MQYKQPQRSSHSIATSSSSLRQSAWPDNALANCWFSSVYVTIDCIQYQPLPDLCVTTVGREQGVSMPPCQVLQVRTQHRRTLRFPTALRSMATDAGYKRCFPPALDLCHDPVFDNCYMPEIQLSNPRKRQRTEQRPLQLNGTLQAQLKKQKLSYPATGFQPPAAFWDNLSKLWLTKGALEELDRRNIQAAPNPLRPSYRRLHRPITRRALDEWKKNRPPTQSAAEFLSNCTSRCLK